MVIVKYVWNMDMDDLVSDSKKPIKGRYPDKVRLFTRKEYTDDPAKDQWIGDLPFSSEKKVGAFIRAMI